MAANITVDNFANPELAGGGPDLTRDWLGRVRLEPGRAIEPTTALYADFNPMNDAVGPTD